MSFASLTSYADIYEDKGAVAVAEAPASTSKRVLVGDYEVSRRIGKGAFGEVYQVKHKDTNTLYAMKAIDVESIRYNKYVGESSFALPISSLSC